MSAEDEFQRMLRVCENPKSEVRFCFADGEWEQASGPDFLKRLGRNKSGGVSIDWVIEKRPATNGQGQ